MPPPSVPRLLPDQIFSVMDPASPVGVVNVASPVGVVNVASPVGVVDLASPVGVVNLTLSVGVAGLAPPVCEVGSHLKLVCKHTYTWTHSRLLWPVRNLLEGARNLSRRKTMVIFQ